MSFRVEFQGSFTLTPHLTPCQVEYLRKFSDTKRMQRNESIAEKKPDPARKAVGLPIGRDGEYFTGGHVNYTVNGRASCMPDTDDSVLKDYPPTSQPGYWCPWRPSEDGNFIEPKGCGVASDDIEWLEYVIEHFLTPWGIAANGTVTWRDEECDEGAINVADNEITEEFN